MAQRPTADLRVIDAPYNFVPLAEQVVVPDWADQVSHDLPMEHGLCGEIHYRLTALSPLLVGGRQTKNPDGSTTVQFFRTPAGDCAIPGSSLKGMIRAVLEIATFSRMGMVDDKRYGLRDISGRCVAESYANRVRNRVDYGLMRIGAGGEPEITPCDMARLSHRDLETWWKTSPPIFAKRTSVKEKYSVWNKLCHRNGIADVFQIPFQLGGEAVTGIGKGPHTGFPVLTGQISDSLMEKRGRSGKVTRGKYHDFMFHSPRSNETFAIQEVDPAAWRDFLFIHGDEDGKPDMSWPGFWKRRFWDRNQVPVFYIRDGDRLQIGLAFMPKLAGDFSIHDMIGHTSRAHLDVAAEDFATLIFGRVGDTPDQALRGRVQLELATLEGDAVADAQPPAILSSPKPTYFPSYLSQDAAGPSWKLKGGDNAQYATYLDNPAAPDPRLRGWKRYPTRPDGEVSAQRPNGPDQEKNKKIQLHLEPLKAGCRFRGRVHFHNLLPEELGALVWSLKLGGGDARHGLGLGKSFGFGQVRLEIDEPTSLVVPNDEKADPIGLSDAVERFKGYMDDRLGASWESTPQIRSLTLMADPEHRKRFPGQLRHMVLARLPDPQEPHRKVNINQFTDAKQAALTLAPYVAATSVPPPPEKPKEAEWPSVALKYEPGPRRITAYHEGQTALADGADAKKLRESFSNAKLKKLKNGNLKTSIKVALIGGKTWKIVALVGK